MSALAYLTADVTGWQSLLFWFGMGIPLAAVVVVVLVKVSDWSITRWPGDLGSDESEAAPRDPTARFTTVITALAWTGVLILVATR